MRPPPLTELSDVDLKTTCAAPVINSFYLSFSSSINGLLIRYNFAVKEKKEREKGSRASGKETELEQTTLAGTIKVSDKKCTFIFATDFWTTKYFNNP